MTDHRLPLRLDDVDHVLCWAPPRSRWVRLKAAWAVLRNRQGACQVVVNYRDDGEESAIAVLGVSIGLEDRR